MWTPLVGVVVVLAALVPGSSARATATKAGARPFATLQFQPSQVALASAGGEVFVLGYKTCTINTCSGPELWAGTGSSFVQRTAPPGTKPGYLSRLVFANALDGYALNPQVGAAAPDAYATTDGGINWSHISFGRNVGLMSVVTADGWFYGVTEHCVIPKGTDGTCNDYRLARSLAGSMSWSSVPIPGTKQLTWQQPGLSAWGREVDVLLPGPGKGETLLGSEGGLVPLRVVAHQAAFFSTIGACQLTATSLSSLWAVCPFGMTEGWFYSSDGGRHFKQFWQPFQTGGTNIDPVSGDVAFRYTGGVATSLPSELEVTTNGGASFTPVAHLPFAGEMAFLTVQHGYMIGSATAKASASGLIQTFDGGHTWHKVVFEPSVNR